MLWYVSYGTFFKPCFISLEYVIYRPQIRECQIRDIWSPAKKSARHIFFPFDLKNVESTILLFFHSNPKNYISSYNNMLLIARSTISFISRTPPDSTFFKANEKKTGCALFFAFAGDCIQDWSTSAQYVMSDWGIRQYSLNQAKHKAIQWN